MNWSANTFFTVHKQTVSKSQAFGPRVRRCIAQHSSYEAKGVGFLSYNPDLTNRRWDTKQAFYTRLIDWWSKKTISTELKSKKLQVEWIIRGIVTAKFFPNEKCLSWSDTGYCACSVLKLNTMSWHLVHISRYFHENLEVMCRCFLC